MKKQLLQQQQQQVQIKCQQQQKITETFNKHNIYKCKMIRYQKRLQSVYFGRNWNYECLLWKVD